MYTFVAKEIKKNQNIFISVKGQCYFCRH